MIELLAQVVAEAEVASKVFGLTIAEWVLLIGAATALADAVRSRLKTRHGDSKLQIVMEAIEDTHDQFPEAGKLAKRIARSKATRMGFEVGSWGLEEDAKKLTRRLKRKPLGPDDPTPDPEAK